MLAKIAEGRVISFGVLRGICELEEKNMEYTCHHHGVSFMGVSVPRRVVLCAVRTTRFRVRRDGLCSSTLSTLLYQHTSTMSTIDAGAA